MPALALAGAEDPVVPPAMTGAALPGVALRWHRRGGHLLPRSDPQWCAGHIRDFALGLAGIGADMNGRARNAAIGARFGRAAARYEAHARPSAHAARRLAEDIARLDLPPRPRILEIGCGTGLLTRELARRLGPADWMLTDISPAMLEIARLGPAPQGSVATRRWTENIPTPARRLRPHLLQPGGAVVRRPERGLGRLAALLAPGGHLAIATLAEDTFAEWRAAHARAGLDAGTPAYPAPGAIRPAMGNLAGAVRAERLVQQHRDGLHFLQDLKGIGATAAAPGHQPLGAAALRRVLATFNEQGASVTYHLAYGMWKKTDSRAPALRDRH